MHDYPDLNRPSGIDYPYLKPGRFLAHPGHFSGHTLARSNLGLRSNRDKEVRERSRSAVQARQIPPYLSNRVDLIFKI